MTEQPSDDAWTTGEHGETTQHEGPLPVPDLRVARVIEARAHPKADRLLLLTLDVGEPAHRQVVAGIAGKYALDELTGKHVVIVANLQPARLRGELSQGMVLATGDDVTLGLLLAPEASPGTRVAAPGAPTPSDQITIDGFQRHEIVAEAGRVLMDGSVVESPRLITDRGVTGRLR